MKQQDKLRNSLREYYDTQESSFNEGDWQQASAYLSATRRKHKAKRFVVFIFVFFSVLLTVLFSLRSIDNDERTVSSLSEQKKKPEEASQAAFVQPPTLTGQSLRTTSTPGNVRQHSTKSLISVGKKQKPDSKINAGLPPGVNSQTFESRSNEQETNSIIPMEVTSEINVSTNDFDIAPAIVANIAPAEPVLSGNASPEPSEKLATMQGVGQAQEDKLSGNQAEFSAKETPEMVVDAPLQTTPLVLNDSKKENTPTDTIKPEPQANSLFTTIVDTSRAQSKPDTTATLQVVLNDTLSKTPGYKNWVDEGLYFETGAAWLYGWKGAAKRDARGFSPHIGINYMSRFSHNSGFSFGLAYFNVPNLANSSKVSRVSSYEYGEHSNVTVITPSSVYYLVAPLRFHYYINSRNSFATGLNLAVLLNVYATVTSYDEAPGFSKNYKTEKLGGYTEGFSWFDAQFTLCYRRRINSSLGVQSEIFLGLTDMKQNEFFNLYYKERNSGAKLSFIYYVSGKK